MFYLTFNNKIIYSKSNLYAFRRYSLEDWFFLKLNSFCHNDGKAFF